MKQLSLFKFTTIALLLINISMVAFFLLTKPRPPHQGPPGPHGRQGHQGPPRKSPPVLNLDKEQEAAFFGYVRKHGDQMDSISEQQRILLKPYFRSLIDPIPAAEKDSMLTEFQQLERRKIEATYRHFEEVKSILKEDQEGDFESFVTNALDKILLTPRKRGRPPKDF